MKKQTTANDILFVLKSSHATFKSSQRCLHSWPEWEFRIFFFVHVRSLLTKILVQISYPPVKKYEGEKKKRNAFVGSPLR